MVLLLGDVVEEGLEGMMCERHLGRLFVLALRHFDLEGHRLGQLGFDKGSMLCYERKAVVLDFCFDGIVQRASYLTHAVFRDAL